MAALLFDADTHRYTTPEGVVVRSVTQILTDVGLGIDHEALGLADVAARKAAIGTAVHQATAHSDNGELVSVDDPQVAAYLDAWHEFRVWSGLRPLVREYVVYHEPYGYCGTLDGVFLRENGAAVLVDIKTGTPPPYTPMQLWAYTMAWCESEARVIDEQWCVQLVPRKTPPYVVTKYGLWEDAQTWLACLRVYSAQRKIKRTR